MNMPVPVLIDIMRGGQFICQLRYTKRGFPEMINGKIEEVHRMKDIEDFVYSCRPSLKGTGIHIEFSNQRV